MCKFLVEGGLITAVGRPVHFEWVPRSRRPMDQHSHKGVVVSLSSTNVGYKGRTQVRRPFGMNEFNPGRPWYVETTKYLTPYV